MKKSSKRNLLIFIFAAMTLVIVQTLISVSPLKIIFSYLLILILLTSAINPIGRQLISLCLKVLKIIKSNFNIDSILTSLGSAVLIIALFELAVSIRVELEGEVVDFSWILWLSNILPWIMSYSFIFRNRLGCTMGLIASLIFEITWTSDFIGRLVFNLAPFGGIADYMFSTNNLHFFVNLNHLFFIPLFAFGVVRLGVHRKASLWMIVYALIIEVVSYFLSSETENANCVFRSCLNLYKFNFGPFGNIVFWSVVPQIILGMPINFALWKIDTACKNVPKKTKNIVIKFLSHNNDPKT